MWVTGVVSAISIKLSSSIDDVVWLAPFLTSSISIQQRWTRGMVYVSVCLGQTVLAFIIAYSGRAAVEKITHGAKDVWSTDKILTVVSGVLLLFFAAKLLYEYIEEMREDAAEKAELGENEEESKAEKGYSELPPSSTEPEEDTAERVGPTDDEQQSRAGTGEAEADLAGTESIGSSPRRKRSSLVGLSPEEVEEELERRRKKAEWDQLQTLFVMSFVGSIDDLTLFVPMLVGKGFGFVQLIVGGFIAAVSITMLCVGVGLCKPVADCLEKVPLFAIVVAFATILIAKAVTME